MGKSQARETSKLFETHMKPDLIVVSPLMRTLETATLIFPQDSQTAKVWLPLMCLPMPPHVVFLLWCLTSFLFKFLALEGVRERCGRNPCDKRRSVSAVSPLFAHIDFSAIEHDEDTIWQDTRETTEHLLERARGVVKWLKTRPGEPCAVLWVFLWCDSNTKFLLIVNC